MSAKLSFFAELRRRNVLRAGALYAAGAWLLVQVVTQVLPLFDVPSWSLRWVVVACAIGFPFWLAFAWFYEITPSGLKRESQIAPSDSIAHSTGRKLDFWIIGIMAVAIVLLVTNQFVLRRDVTNTADTADAKALAATLAEIPQKSIAVLPLANDSGDKDQQYFSDGLSEDLINALSQFEGLKVIGRNSAFQFRNSKDTARSIGAKLGVAHLLEGSVRRAGDTVRISAELINTSDASTLWSQHYDRPYKDLFALQDEITHAVATALQAKLMNGGGAVVQSDRPPGGNLDAYTAYLRGAGDYNVNTKQSYHDDIAAFEQAIRLDPHYAAAYAQLSLRWGGLAAFYLGGTEAAQAYAKARAAVNTALRLAPSSSLGHRARSALLLNADMDWAGAEAEARRALQLAPNSGAAKISLASLAATLGHLEGAVTLTRQALAADPRYDSRYVSLATYLYGLDRLDEAANAIDTAIALNPGGVGYRAQLAIVDILRGDAKAALATAQRELPGTWREIVVALTLQIGQDRAAADAALKNLIAGHASESAYQIAQVYALRRDRDNMFKWLGRAWSNRDPGVVGLLSDPFILRYQHDPRFAAFCKKVGLPTETDAKAMP